MGQNTIPCLTRTQNREYRHKTYCDQNDHHMHWYCTICKYMHKNWKTPIEETYCECKEEEESEVNSIQMDLENNEDKESIQESEEDTNPDKEFYSDDPWDEPPIKRTKTEQDLEELKQTKCLLTSIME